MERKEYDKPTLSAVLVMERYSLMAGSQRKGGIVVDTGDGSEELTDGGGADPGTALSKHNCGWGANWDEEN